MKYIVQGAHVTKLFDVKKFGDEEKGYIKKPEFESSDVYKWENILEFECDHLEYSDNNSSGLSFGSDGSVCFVCKNNTIHISESESVWIKNKIFRADKCITYLQSNKILSEKEDNETNAQKYQEALQEYFGYIIEKHPKVNEYLDMHEVKDVLENIDKIKEMVLNTSANDKSVGKIIGTLPTIKDGRVVEVDVEWNPEFLKEMYKN